MQFAKCTTGIINERTARRDLVELVEKEMLIRHNEKRTTKYLYL